MWTFRGGAMLLQRETDRPRALVGAQNAFSTFIAVDASDLRYPMQGVPDLDLIHHGCIADVEFRYFAADELVASPGPIAIGPSVVVQN